MKLKQRYASRWAESNARERLVLSFLNEYLPEPFEAKLTGLGAGSTEYIGRWYGGLLEAFDISIWAGRDLVAFVEVTGIDYRKKPKKRIGYCVGEWKLEKAFRYGVERRVWVAFVIESRAQILWAPLTKFYSSIAARAKLYEDEDWHRCLPTRKWHPFYREDYAGKGKIPFLNWLKLVTVTEGPVRG